MPYKFDIRNVNNDFDDQEPDLFEDYPLDEDENDEYINEVDCFACFGTGEGHASDTTCSFCNGSGTIKKRKY